MAVFRGAVKRFVFVASLALTLPLVVAVWLEKQLSRGEQVFVLCAQLLAVLPGLPGAWLRGAFYFGTLDACSSETHVGFGSVFTHRGASLGRRASMGCYCVIGHADIGEGVMIGSRVSIPSGKRQHFDAEGRLSADAHVFDRLSIGDRCWIGEGAIILADVGGECVVSAGAVVSRAMPGGHLIAGNPARAVGRIGTAESTASQEASA